MPPASHALDSYRDKRDFQRTAEPAGASVPEASGNSYCVQQHAATRLHYDFRLELGGVLKSWAVPKGPSLVPGQKRLAVETEDHPVEYGWFEGVIPEGEYGGGTVMLWDRGTWSPTGDALAGLAKGKLELELHGEKLHGKFVLVKVGSDGPEWLLIKRTDEHARKKGSVEVVETATRSVASDRELDEIAADAGATPKQCKTAKRVTQATAARAAGGDPLPDFVEFQLATLVDGAPDGEAWFHEIKLDGYRVQCRIDGDQVELLTRNRIDRAGDVPGVTEALRGVGVGTALLDGELVWFDEGGRTVFSRLVDALGSGGHGVAFVAFDLLHLEGRDLRREPLHARKEALRRVLEGVPYPVRYLDHVVGEGPAFLAAACEQRLEGIISKQADGAYRGHRGRDWLKIKCLRRQELVVVGFTPPTHARDCFGSLVLGVYEDDALIYAGRVGTGFDGDDRAQIGERLEALAVDACPLVKKPRAPGLTRVQWLRPELIAEIAFTEWTTDGRLRHPSFQGLRDDKAVTAVAREHAASANDPAPADAKPAGVTLTHPNKVLVADAGLTKIALARYYEAIAPLMLPHLHGRPLMLLRCPDGSDKPCFYQKHAGHALPDGVITFDLREDDGTRATYLAVESAMGLVGTVQMGALELHVWGSRRAAVEKPDRLVIDLDPDPAVGFSAVVSAATEIRDRLADAELECFVMSTGGKGVHIVAPLDPVHPFDVVKQWARRFAEQLVRAAPTRYIATASKERRRGKIFLDYLRNGRGASAVCPYSTRARPGAPVAVPLSWEELVEMAAPLRLGADAVLERVGRIGDPWAAYPTIKQRL